MVEIPKGDILNLYASLMAEVKARLSSVERQLDALPKYADNRVQQGFLLEFCYLHLRRVTELAALAVLVAHNPIPESRHKAFVKEWNPDLLFKKLADLNPEAFPQPVHHSEDGHNDQVGHYVEILRPTNPSFEVRDELRRIYNECGDKLHTGHLKSILQDRSKPYSVDFIRDALTSLCRHLNLHITQLPDRRVLQAKMHLNAPTPVETRWLDPNPPLLTPEP